MNNRDKVDFGTIFEGVVEFNFLENEYSANYSTNIQRSVLFLYHRNTQKKEKKKRNSKKILNLPCQS